MDMMDNTRKALASWLSAPEVCSAGFYFVMHRVDRVFIAKVVDRVFIAKRKEEIPTSKEIREEIEKTIQRILNEEKLKDKERKMDEDAETNILFQASDSSLGANRTLHISDWDSNPTKDYDKQWKSDSLTDEKTQTKVLIVDNGVTVERFGANDFGTLHSGFAILFKHKFDSAFSKGFVKEWLLCFSLTENAPTVLVMNFEDTLEAFGYEAQYLYKDLVEKDELGHYFYIPQFKIMLNKKLGESGPRNNKPGGKASKVRYDRSTDSFGFLAKRNELPKTEKKKSSKQLWLDYCQAESPGESKTLLSKPLYGKRPETENFIICSSKPAEHCTSAEKQNAIIPDTDRLLCKVCYINELSIVFLPCSHMVACRRCAARLKSCPVCRSGIEEALPANLHE